MKRLVGVHQANVVRASLGDPAVPVGLHLVFIGPPGTCRTTVARLIARISWAICLLPTGQLVEVDRSGLIGRWVGHIATKVMEVADQADRGVLFIDEAHSLVGNTTHDFGPEAIDTLIKAMQDRRERLGVIVVGYSETMRDLIDMNAGLASRFKTFIDFSNYTPVEMLQIFQRDCDKYTVIMDSETSAIVLELFALSATGSTGGNGRYTRNLFETMFTNLFMRAVSDGRVDHGELLSFHPDDVPASAP